MSCPETAAVEALQDGRLATVLAETLRLHLVTCAECGREAARLERVRGELARLREAEASPWRVAAGRMRLLEAANGVEPRRTALPARVVGFALAACVATLVVWFGVQRALLKGATIASTRAASDELALTITPGAGTTWSREHSELTETLRLTEGELGVRVSRHDVRRRLLVELPDGELEDVGTVFAVAVHAGKTRKVAVTEGRVALRLHERNELILSAGEVFELPDETAPAASASSLAPAESSRAVPSAPSAVAKNGLRAGASNDEPPACPSAGLFEDGVQAFKQAEFTAAAGLLDRFASACGSSNHAEDAAYLRMVALARAGQADAARAQALAYLKRFPHGFRRKEAERLAGAE
jgi:hypothetical protein